MRARATQRTFDQIGLLQTQRPEDAFVERVAQPHACCRLDDEPEHDVVAAVIRPPLAGWKQTRLLQDMLKLVARPELPAMGRIPPIRLEERHHVDGEIVEAARVIQELADRDALDKRRRLPVKVE